MAQRNALVEIVIALKNTAAVGFKNLKSTVGDVTDSVFSLKGALLGLGTGAVGATLEHLVEMFADEERAVVRLNTALRVNGQYTEAGSESIQHMAEEMAQLVAIHQHAAVDISASIATIATHLTTGQLAQAQKVVIGLAAAMGRSVESTTQMVARAVTGLQSRQLRQLGINISQNADQQTRFNQLLQQSAKFFEVATGTAKSLSGQIEFAHVAWQELEETLGEVIARSLGVDDRAHGITARLKEMRQSIKDNMGEWVRWGKIVSDAIGIVTTSVIGAIRAAFDVGEVVGAGFDLIVVSIVRMVEDAANGVIGILNSLFSRIDAKLHELATDPRFKPWIDQAKRAGRTVPGAFSFRIDTIDTTTETDQQAIDIDTMRTAGERFDATLAKIRASWGRLFADMKAKPLPASSFEGQLQGAGGGRNLPRKITDEEKATDAINKLAQLRQEFERGAISSGEFARRLGKDVNPELVRLIQHGDLDEQTLGRLQAQFKGLREEALKLGIVLPDIVERSFGTGFRSELGKSADAVDHLGETIGKTTFGALQQFTEAAAAAFGKLTDGSANAAKAFEAAMLEAIASVAEMYGKMFAGLALGAIAGGISGLNPKGFAAGAEYFAAAAAMYAVAGLAHGAAARTGGGGGAGAAAGANTAAVTAPAPPLTVVIKGNVNPLAPDFVDAIAIAIGEATGRGVILEREP